jgi:hypothetical protein
MEGHSLIASIGPYTATRSARSDSFHRENPCQNKEPTPPFAAMWDFEDLEVTWSAARHKKSKSAEETVTVFQSSNSTEHEARSLEDVKQEVDR